MLFNKDNYKIVHQGIDTLVIGVNCTDEEYFNTTYQHFIARVARLKADAQSLATYGDKYVLDNLGLNYGDFKISSKGLGQYFGYISNDDMFCTISDTKFKNQQIYHLKIQFRSIYLLKYGHEYCFNQINAFLSDIFSHHYSIKILRLDICSDVAGIKYTPQDFLKFRSLRRYSNYTEHINKYDDNLIECEEQIQYNPVLEQINVNNFVRFNRFEGISFGKSPCMFRIYDKIKQVTQKDISKLIFTKWEICGFDFNRDMYVFRHEVEFGRSIIKKLLPINCTDEATYIFNNLGKFWAYGLSLCKWYDLTDDEVSRLTNSNIQTGSKRKIYQRCEFDNSRLKFWDMLHIWDETSNTKLLTHNGLITKDISKAKKALKAFISAVYTNMGYNHNNFLIVLDEVKKDLEKQGLSLHEYGLNKLAGNFNSNEELIKSQSLDIVNPLSSICYYSVDDFIMALKSIRDDKYKYNIKKGLEYLRSNLP